MTAKPKSEASLLDTLEKAIRDVISAKDASISEKLQAITAGTKVIAIKHKLEASEDSGFFS